MFGISSPSICLSTPPEVRLPDGDTPDKEQFQLSGHVEYRNFSSPPEQNVCTKVYLVRLGQLNLSVTQSQKNQRRRTSTFTKIKTPRNIHDFEQLDTLAEVSISGSNSSPRKTSGDRRTFELSLPDQIVPTATLPQAEIQYAVVAKCSLSNGNILWTSQPLKISRQSDTPLQFQPTRTTTFPESTIEMKVDFNQMSTDSKLPVSLFLGGLEDPNGSDVPNILSLSWIRDSEIRRKVPHLIRWELEEKSIVLAGEADGTSEDAIVASTAKRSEAIRTIAKGKFQPCLKFPDMFAEALSSETAFDTRVPFDVTLPTDMNLSSSTELSVCGDRILHTIPISLYQSPETFEAHGQPRFAYHREYRLAVHVEIGEDIYHKGTGSLVHRRAAQHVYGVICHSVSERKGDGDGVSGRGETPPSYEAAMGT